jgi:MOSC domain-containing protein YiiM
MRQVPAARAVAGHGLEGCRHARKWKEGHARQLLLLDVASHAALGLPLGALKENVALEGLPLESLPAGQRLALGPEVVVELSGPCVPCARLNALRPGLLKEAWGQRGQLARILVGGALQAGDAVRLLDVNPAAPRPIRPRLP